MTNDFSIYQLRPEVLSAMDEFDPLADFLGGQVKETTRKQYQKNLRLFFQWAYQCEEPSPGVVANFLQLDQAKLNRLLGTYKSQHRGQITPATINNRLCSLRSFLKYARLQNLTKLSAEDVSGEKAVAYRDTTGVSPEKIADILEQCDRQTEKGRRNYAMLLLLWENALRRAEVVNNDVCHFDRENLGLHIMGKGRNEREPIAITRKVCDAITESLCDRTKIRMSDPLFVATTNVTPLKRLSSEGLYAIVREYAKNAGISRVMSPHRIRHSSVTAYLDASGGDLRSAQSFTRHKDPKTLAIYDDNRQHLQKGVSEVLSDLI